MCRTGSRTGVTAFAVALAGLALCASAGAEEVLTRTEYVTQLEEVCKPGAKETQKAMNGVRDDVKNPSRIPVAAKKFQQAADIFGNTIKTIAEVPRPPADRDRLREWFVYLGRQESYLQEIAGELRSGHTIKAQRLTARFIHNGNLANNVTLAFGFNYCSFKFSRYG